MNVLHVEDDKRWFERTVLPTLQTFCSEIHHVECHDSAVELINKTDIDYIILDQSIPLNPQNPMPDIANGIMFADYVRMNFPGTPILILSGQSRDQVVEKYIEDQERTFFWDGRLHDLVKTRPKGRVFDAIELVKTAKNELDNLENIELDHPQSLVIDRNHKRVIKLFAKRFDAVCAIVTVINEGLSSANVLRIALLNTQGKEFHYALAKIDSTEKIEMEAFNFNSYICKLPVGSFPTLLGQYSAGCRNIKGIFYQFASEYDSDYFDQILISEDRAIDVLKKVIPLFDIWEQSKKGENKTIHEVRQLLCTDDKFDTLTKSLEKIDTLSFEKNSCQFYFSTQHADLHGKNILTSAQSTPIIIDYGDIKYAPSVLDIVTLELSPFFHPSTEGKLDFSLELFNNWFDDESYIKNHPLGKVASYLRKEKSNRAFMNKDYIVTVYAYSIRQLSFSNTNHEIALTLIEASINKYNQI